MMVLHATYTNLWPLRQHILQLDTITRRVQLLSDPSLWNIPSSSWHAERTHVPGCSAFNVYDFSHTGSTANYTYTMTFQLHQWSAILCSVRRYFGKCLHAINIQVELIIFDYMRLPTLPILGPQSAAYFDSDSGDRADEFMDSNENSTLILSTTNFLAP